MADILTVTEATLTSQNSITSSDNIRTISNSESKKITASNLAKYIVEDYDGSTLNGTAQTIQDVITEIVSDIPTGSDVTGVKGDEEENYRTGDVSLSPADIGAAEEVHTHLAATTSTDGFMSAEDKIQLTSNLYDDTETIVAASSSDPDVSGHLQAETDGYVIMEVEPGVVDDMTIELGGSELALGDGFPVFVASGQVSFTQGFFVKKGMHIHVSIEGAETNITVSFVSLTVDNS